MSWYMFGDASSFQHRGIKVDGYQYLQRPNLNLSWGIDQKQFSTIQPDKTNNIQSQQPPKDDKDKATKIKVMTETSEEEEELIKLIKSRKTKENINDRSNNYQNYIKSRSKSSQGIQNDPNSSNQSKFIKNSEFSKRVRYLENSLLPHCRQDNMDTVLDHTLTKEVAMEESRISKNSVSPSNKPQSILKLGDGFNPFKPYKQVKKDLTQKLREMYDYEDKYKERYEKNQVKLG